MENSLPEGAPEVPLPPAPLDAGPLPATPSTPRTLTWLQMAALVERLGMGLGGGGFTCPACPERNGARAGVLHADGRWNCDTCGGGGGPVELVAQWCRIGEGEAEDFLHEALSRGLFFGDASKAEAAKRIYVTVGISDYLALVDATMPFEGMVVLGMLDLLSLDIVLEMGRPEKGKRFVLCAPNDDLNAARFAFEKLGAALERLECHVSLIRPPSPHLTFDAWHAERPLPIRPPEADPPAPPPTQVDGPPKSPPPPPKGGGGQPPSPLPKERLRKSYASLTEILRKQPYQELALGTRQLSWNEMLAVPTLDREPVVDDDYAQIRDRVERRIESFAGKPLEFSTSDIAQAMTQVAHERPYHPVREYVEALQWDNVPRIRQVAWEFFGHSKLGPGPTGPPIEHEIIPVLLEKWFVSAIARVMRPGCKVDTVLVLCGPQGFMKSSFFKALVGDDWFGDTAMDLSKPDAMLQLRECWIYEWAELEAMVRARDHNTVKGFITSGTDRFRRPYGRNFEKHPRVTLIVGTTNHIDFLSDPTGNRRYWPVRVYGHIDLQKLRAWRDQLWAEALKLFRDGVEWHLDAVEAQQLVKLQRTHLRQDPWEDPIVDYISTRAQVTTAEVLHFALEKPLGQLTRADQMRVGAILEQHGWERKQVRDTDGHQKWVYRKDGQGDLPL